MTVQPIEMIDILNNYKRAREQDALHGEADNAGNDAGDILYQALRELMADAIRSFPQAFENANRLL